VEKLTIGRLADGAGVNLETIRYYERIGLMPKPGRTEGGHRNYASAHVRRLTFIRRARELGFAIEDIRALLDLAEPGRVSCGEVQKIAALHLHNVRAKRRSSRDGKAPRQDCRAMQRQSLSHLPSA
jgi:MerR family mercuric resistance operon transcriptional regulator